MIAAAVSPPWWANGVLLAWVAIGVAVAAAGFTFWQAFIVHRNRQSANERALVEWEPAKWVEPFVLTVTSKGPDEARDVWALLTVRRQEVEVKATRVRRGDTLRFELPSSLDLWEQWDYLAPRIPKPGEPIMDDVTVFSYGLRIAWHSPFGRQEDRMLPGSIRREIAYRHEPTVQEPWAKTFEQAGVEPDDEPF